MPLQQLSSKTVLTVKPPTLKTNSALNVLPKALKAKNAGEEPKRRAALEEIGNKTDVKHVLQSKTNLLPQKTMGTVKPAALPVSRIAVPVARKPLAVINKPVEKDEPSEPTAEIEDVDKGDEENIYLVGVYVNHVYAYLLELEDSTSISSDFLKDSAVNGKMRALLIDWIFEISGELDLLPESAQMSVAIIDRYLQVDKTVNTSNLQLVGSAALLIAAKYEEIFPPSLSDLVEYADKSFTKEDLMKIELKIIKALDYKLGRPVPITFLRRFSKVTKSQSIHHTYGKYFIELALTDATLASVKPSLIAAAALYMAHFVVGNHKTIKQSLWTPTIAHYSKYKFMQFRKIIPLMANTVKNSATSNLKTVRMRYATAQQKGVSLSPVLQPNSKVLEALLKC